MRPKHPTVGKQRSDFLFQLNLSIKNKALLPLITALFSVFLNPILYADHHKGHQAEATRRLEVLFLGSNPGSHQPLTRFKTIRRALGVKGINFTYANEPTALTPENLAKYDALLVYGNHDVLQKDQEKALLDYSAKGGGCVFLHSACGCFRNSEAFIKLLGAQFKSHGQGVFRPTIVKPDHPVMKGFPGFECWDETYIHQKHNKDRLILQKREEEPWTWVRTNDKGRIFYTASGHDHRCWDLPEYHHLVLRGILWSVGDQKATLVRNLKLPALSYYKPKVPIIHDKSWGKPLDRRVPHTDLQNPLPVEESLKLAQVPSGFELQLFASEPDIINPVALSWDEKGRLWTVEAYDYPNNVIQNTPGQDRIKILVDTDRDGKADQISTFAKDLTICTSVLPWQDGCITTDSQEMVHLTDTNHDGKADQRRVIFKGIRLWDTHACVSNLRQGLDGWIYATVGYAGVDIKLVGQQHKHSQGLFRFKADGSAYQFLQGTSNNTWGLGFTEEGRIMGSTANNNPSWWFDVPTHLYQKSGITPKNTPQADSKDFIYPITFDYLQVDCHERITAGAGHSIYTARLFPPDWWNQRALICAPTGKLVTAPRIERHGAGFKSTGFEQNIYASADAWSSPVAAEIGPDGAVYIADWYNSIIQHNIYGPGQKKGNGNAYISEHRDRKHGRIYRILPKHSIPHTHPSLDTSKQRLTALSNDNLFWRLTAQRLILEKDGKSAIPALTKLIDTDNIATLHALHLLGQLLSTDEYISTVTKCLSYKTPGIQSTLISYLPPTNTTALTLAKKLETFSAQAKHAALLKIAEAKTDPALLQILKEKKGHLQKDNHLLEALAVAMGSHGATLGMATAKAPPFSLSAKRGAKIYQTTGLCITCHQPSGEGVKETFPPLNRSEWLSRNHEDAIKLILKGLNGPITVRGKKFNGGMPAQPNLTDKQITDVLNYVRNSWENQLGDIAKEEITRIRAEIKERTEPYTAKDFPPHTKASTPKASHSYDFSQSLNDQIGRAHAQLAGSASLIKPTSNGIDLSTNTGEPSNAIKNYHYLHLPNGIISQAARSGVIGTLSIETTLTVSENRPWAEAWCFGASNDGEDISNGGQNASYITLIPLNPSTKTLRLSARAGGKELFLDAKTPLKPGQKHHITATFSRRIMSLYLNGELLGRHPLPEKLDLTTFKDNNNWLGRSQYPDPLFDGIYQDLKIYSSALPSSFIKDTHQK